MNNPIGDDTQSARDADDREGELLCLKIKAQLEDLFSDSHLAEDGFLLKHVQKNKEGYVNLKLLTCLKKIKALTTNWYMTLAGAESSPVLEVNDECTKVRRLETLPKWLLCSPTSRLLLVWNIPMDRAEAAAAARGLEPPALSERILRKFGAFGSVTSLWILLPDKELPKELQCYAKRHRELGQRLCAVVKFAHLEAVRQTCSALKAEDCSGEGLCVAPLGCQSMHHFTKEESEEENGREQPGKSQENPPEERLSQVCQETPDTSQPQEPQKPQEPEEPQKPQEPQEPQEPQKPQELEEPQVQEHLEHLEPQEPQKPQEFEEPQEPEEPQKPQETQEPQEPQEHQEPQRPQKPQEPLFDPIQTPREQTFTEQVVPGLNQRYGALSGCSGDHCRGKSQSPWVLKRKTEARTLNVSFCLMQRVLRQPFGPNGTRGFKGGERLPLLWRQTICAV